MRHGVHYAPFAAPISPSPSLSPSPSPPPAAAVYADQSMLLSVFLALFLPCVGMSAVFLVYICLLWYAAGNNSNNHHDFPPPVKPAAPQGLSAAELEKLPKVTGKELVLGTECAVCLDEIESDQTARILPGCNHGFHLECADAWLSKRPVCPVCRSKLDAKFFAASDDNPC